MRRVKKQISVEKLVVQLGRQHDTNQNVLQLHNYVTKISSAAVFPNCLINGTVGGVMRCICRVRSLSSP